MIDEHGLSWKVILVSDSGFFTDSYLLFASNVILSALAYVYWDKDSQSTEIIINALTLAGSACGQILFGVLADVCRTHWSKGSPSS